VSLLFSPFAVLVGMVYVHLPFMILPLYTNLEKHDPVLLDAAQDLGAGAWQRFWRVTWPLSCPACFPARPWCSSRCWACSPSPTSSAAPATCSSAT
jgi:ABC-type spermidine/putrescine transport system permease subunit I